MRVANNVIPFMNVFVFALQRQVTTRTPILEDGLMQYVLDTEGVLMGTEVPIAVQPTEADSAHLLLYEHRFPTEDEPDAPLDRVDYALALYLEDRSTDNATHWRLRGYHQTPVASPLNTKLPVQAQATQVFRIARSMLDSGISVDAMFERTDFRQVEDAERGDLYVPLDLDSRRYPVGYDDDSSRWAA